MKDLIINFLKTYDFDFKIDSGAFPCFKVFLDDKKIIIDTCSFSDLELNLYFKVNIKIINLKNKIEKTEFRIISASSCQCLLFFKDVILNEVEK